MIFINNTFSKVKLDQVRFFKDIDANLRYSQIDEKLTQNGLFLYLIINENNDINVFWIKLFNLGMSIKRS
jgi:hypothetical protein